MATLKDFLANRKNHKHGRRGLYHSDERIVEWRAKLLRDNQRKAETNFTISSKDTE